MKKDTIAAISTALGQGAISIVRMSGDDVFSIIKKIYKTKDLSAVPSHTIHYGKITDGSTTIDEVLISVFRSPKTFTTEDMIEINCHGGPFVANKILSLLLTHGARLAENGEFTERAFMHGRIDLTQAESVMDIIEARSDNALHLANKGLDGKIYELITSLRDTLLNIIANIEVNIDYPEYDDVETLTDTILKPRIESLLSDISAILHQANVGKVIKEGVKTAIIGRPNVGKSSLLNALLKEDKAIVTEIQGTTRDTVEGEINIGGLILKLIDTAGIRDSEDLIEKIGIDKAKQLIEEAELILYVINNNEPLQDEDQKLLALTEHKKRIVIINKIDLQGKLNQRFENSVQLSALKKTNIEALENKIEDMFLKGDINIDQNTYLSNARHIALMRQVKQHLEDAKQSAIDSQPVDIIEIDLKTAWELLGEIIGVSEQHTLIDELFSKFCLGK